MNIQGRTMTLIALGTLLATGCGGDLGRQVMSNPEMQQKIMGMIAANTGTATQMIDHLLAGDSARTLLIEKVLGNGEAAQAMMVEVAKDRTLLDGVLNLAVQDSAMKDHVLTLFQGMRMAGVR